MTRLNDFRQGDLVNHQSQGNGVVISCDENEISVRFDRKSVDGGNFIGTYDATWFRLYPHLLSIVRKAHSDQQEDY